MAYLYDVILLAVVGVNIVLLMGACTLSTGTAKHPKKKKMIATVILLAINIIFDIVCQIGFILNGTPKNGVVFVLFVPLAGCLLYEDIKELYVIPKKREEE